MPLPEQGKQQDVVDVADPEVVLTVPPGHHHAGKPCDDSKQLQEAHPRSPHRERYVLYVEKVHLYISKNL